MHKTRLSILFQSGVRTLKQIYPPCLLAMLLYIQLITLFVNRQIFNGREIAILLCWIPLGTLSYLFLKKKIIYKITLTLFFIGGLVNLCHLLIVKGFISASSLFILLNTNIHEAKDFIDLKFDISMLLLIPYLFLYVLALRNVPNTIIYPKSKYVIVVVLLFSTIYIADNVIHGCFLRKGVPQTTRAFIAFSKELKSYKSLKKRKVKNVNDAFQNGVNKQHVCVLIIGESCNRNHMSLYNYHRKTNPKLEKRNDIFIYENVVSAYSNTLNSILSMLTESNLENKMEIDKSIGLIDVFHSLGYKTYWLSNQLPIGIWDNAVYNMSQTADVSIFTNQNGNSSFESTYLSPYDEKLFLPFSSVLKGNNENKFIVVHLMGSHSSYSKRYPLKYKLFANSSSKKEKLIDEYDNSILYNDFIIDSLLNILSYFSFQDADAVYSAVYLSDHGENVYDEKNKAGHDYSGSLPKSNVEIPFIVWLSTTYKQNYLDKYEIIAKNQKMPFISDDLFHAILDLNNIRCKSFLKTKSIFNANYQTDRLRILEDGNDYDLK